MGVNCNSPGHTAEPVEVPGSKDISNEAGKRLVCIERLKGIIQNKYIEYICSREYRIYPSICCFLKHARKFMQFEARDKRAHNRNKRNIRKEKIEDMNDTQLGEMKRSDHV